MTLQLNDVILAARDADQAFAPQRVPNAVLARFLTRYQKRLVSKATEMEPGVISGQIAIVFPPAGIPNSVGSVVPAIGAGTNSGLPVAPTVGQNLAIPATGGSLQMGPSGFSAVPRVVGNAVEIDFTDAVTIFGPATATATTPTTLTANGVPGWSTGQFANGLSYIEILAGTDVTDRRLITANTANVITVSAAFTAQPDTTSIWRIVEVSSVVNQEMSAVLSLPAVGSKQGYLVKFDASGNPYLDLTAPLVGYFAQGIPLPSYKQLLDGTIYFQPYLGTGQPLTEELTIVDASRRLRAPGQYNAYERGGKLYLIGNPADWELVQSIDLRYVPEPGALTQLTDTFVLPDSAYDALVAKAVAFAAERCFNEQDTPNVDVDRYALLAQEAEGQWLSELGARKRATSSGVKETWLLLFAALGLAAMPHLHRVV